MNELSILIHADSKVGKSTLAATSPLPIVVLDAEGSWRFIGVSEYLASLYGRPLVIREWDPVAGPPPRYDGTWDICHVTIRDWDTLQRAELWLKQAQHDFKSLVLDSVTEAQRRCKANIVAPTQAMQQQDWGVLLGLMDSTIRGLRDLTMDSYNSIDVAVFVAETRLRDGKWRPVMQGQISDALPYWLDIVGYMFVDQEMDANGVASRQVRKLLVSPHPLYEAGERVQGRLGGIITEPTVFGMISQVYTSNGSA